MFKLTPGLTRSVLFPRARSMMANTPNKCITPVMSRSASRFLDIGEDQNIDDLTLTRSDKELLVE
jgi:hypothetical protein